MFVKLFTRAVLPQIDGKDMRSQARLGTIG